MTEVDRQPDLFAAPRLAGLSHAEEFVAPDEEAMLIAAIDATALAPFRFHGWLGKRLTASYGWRYDFDDASFAPAAAIPDWLLPLRDKAARFIGLPPDELAQSLLIRYDPGAGIGWHRDRPVFEHVVGISLGSAATMRFRRRQTGGSVGGFAGGFDRAAVSLLPRSLYHLAGEARHVWEHSIAALAVTRWSITFRSLSAKGRLRASGR
jgi:DNA oxidative demethylase